VIEGTFHYRTIIIFVLFSGVSWRRTTASCSGSTCGRRSWPSGSTAPRCRRPWAPWSARRGSSTPSPSISCSVTRGGARVYFSVSVLPTKSVFYILLFLRARLTANYYYHVRTSFAIFSIWSAILLLLFITIANFSIFVNLFIFETFLRFVVILLGVYTLHLLFYCFYSHVVIFEQLLAQEFSLGWIKFNLIHEKWFYLFLPLCPQVCRWPQQPSSPAREIRGFRFCTRGPWRRCGSFMFKLYSYKC